MGRPLKNSVPKELIEKRREIIASLLSRGMRQYEIVNQLSMPTIRRLVDGEYKDMPNPTYMLNPLTNEPFDKATISRDVKKLLDEWREEAKADIEDFASKQLFELREARRKAWTNGDMAEVRLNMALEMKLLGTARPERKEIKLDDKQFEQMQSAKDRVREKVAMMMAGFAAGDDNDGDDSSD